MSDFIGSDGNGYTITPSPSVGAASWENWCGQAYLALASCVSPDIITPTVVSQMPLRSLQALVAAGLLSTP